MENYYGGQANQQLNQDSTPVPMPIRTCQETGFKMPWVVGNTEWGSLAKVRFILVGKGRT